MSIVLRAIPQQDGSLRLQQPDAHARFDMGNQQLFVTWNGRGDASRLMLVAGAWGGGWQVQLYIDDKPVQFSEARALGRLWQLHNGMDPVQIELDSFLGEASPVARQRLRVQNNDNQPHILHATITLDWRAPVSVGQKMHNIEARLIPRLPGLGHLWSEGWAKHLLPDSPTHMRLHPGGLVAGSGATPLFFCATQPAKNTQRDGKLGVHLHYELAVAPDQANTLDWSLSFGNHNYHTYELTRNAEAYAEVLAFSQTLSEIAAIEEDPLLKSMITAGISNALAMFKVLPRGFSGLVAGREYAYPPRLYFRDSYWTAQILLLHRPALVRQHLLSLATGVHPDGNCPSAVFAPHLAKQWGLTGPDRLDWLPDHFDSPSYLLLLVQDYLAATGDFSILDEQIHPGADPSQPPSTLWTLAQSAVERLIGQDKDVDGLIEKPYEANDWADNVRRNVWVSYDQALYVAALHAVANIARQRAEANAERYERLAGKAWQSMEQQLWDEDKGYFVDYKRPGFIENHLSIDTLVAIRFGLTNETQTQSILAAARKLLQSRNNPEQPYGDWGILCVFPLYRRHSDLFDKSADPYNYHNGSDWPYWDGVYGEILLQRQDPDWRYVLTRWWDYCLEHSWLSPVEYFSPPYPVGGMMNGWSSMPAAALLRSKQALKVT